MVFTCEQKRQAVSLDLYLIEWRKTNIKFEKYELECGDYVIRSHIWNYWETLYNWIHIEFVWITLEQPKNVYPKNT